jgi:hypothetical protein
MINGTGQSNPSRPARAARTAIVTVAALCAASLFGCATPAPIVLHDPVGPWQPQPTPDDGSGQLMVYSATRVTTADDSEYPVHTPYTIYGRDNKVLRDVNNTAGLFSQAPSTVSLPPGRYQVKALAADAGYVIVPVIIEAHRTTIVDLDGTALPKRDEALASGTPRLVRLPDGRAIGAQPE